MPPRLANEKSRLMLLSITSHASELGLIWIACAAELASFMTSVRVSSVPEEPGEASFGAHI